MYVNKTHQIQFQIYFGYQEVLAKEHTVFGLVFRIRNV